MTVASMLFAGGCRILAVPAAARAIRIPRAALSSHHNKHAPSWGCRSSHNSNTALAGEAEFLTTDAGILNATSSSDRYLRVDSQIVTFFLSTTFACCLILNLFLFKFPEVWPVASMSIAQKSTENWTLSYIRRRTCVRTYLQGPGSSSFVSVFLYASAYHIID